MTTKKNDLQKSKLAYVIITTFLILAFLPLLPISHAANRPTVVATINGGGTALMSPPGLAVGKSSFGVTITLFSDGTATGHFDCVDQQGDPTGEGNIFGAATSWYVDGNGLINVNFVGKVTTHGGQPTAVSFTIAFQAFGGAQVGHWTLSAGGLLFCYELVTSGQIDYKPA
jgi:hypothetical protein